MSFGDDWPGVFIRGDNAMAYSIAVKDAIMRLEGKAAHGRECRARVCRAWLSSEPCRATRKLSSES